VEEEEEHRCSVYIEEVMKRLSSREEKKGGRSDYRARS